MLIIHYPDPDFRRKKEGNRELVFDPLRKKWVALTPEEWVRLNFVNYLVKVKLYPAALIAVEKEIRMGELNRRFDVLVYDRSHRPWMLVECKSMEVELDERVLEQLLRYHISMPADFLVITNGKACFGWQKKGMQLELINELPPPA